MTIIELLKLSNSTAWVSGEETRLYFDADYQEWVVIQRKPGQHRYSEWRFETEAEAVSTFAQIEQIDLEQAGA